MELICEKLETKPMPLMTLIKGVEIIPNRIEYKNNRTEREMRNHFLNKTKFDEEIKKKISDNIFVALDSNMFKCVT